MQNKLVIMICMLGIIGSLNTYLTWKKSSSYNFPKKIHK